MAKETFGNVAWTDEDLQTKAKELLGRKLTKTELQTVRDSHAVRHIDDRMVETGWVVIETAINEI